MREFETVRSDPVQWFVDWTLRPQAASQVAQRLQQKSSSGIRYFSAIGRAAPLGDVREVLQEISALEKLTDPADEQTTSTAPEMTRELIAGFALS